MVNLIRNKLRNEEIPNDIEIDSDNNLTEDLAFQDVTNYSLNGNIVDNNKEFSGYTTPTSRDIGENYFVRDKKTNKNISPYRNLTNTSQNTNKNLSPKKMSSNKNSVINSKLSPSRNSALNSKLSSGKNSSINSNISSSKNSAINSNISPSKNSAINSNISPSRNLALKSNLSPSRNSVFNYNLPNKNGEIGKNSLLDTKVSQNRNISPDRNVKKNVKNTNNKDNINRIESSIDIINGRNKGAIDHEEIVKRNILTSALNKPSSFWNNTGNAAENSNVIQNDYLNNGTYDMKSGTLDDLTMTDDIYRNNIPIRTAMSGDRNTTAKYSSLSQAREISDKDYDRIKVTNQTNKKLSPGKNGNIPSATKKKNSIYSKITPKANNIKSKLNDNSGLKKSITNTTYTNIINKASNNGQKRNTLNKGRSDDNDIDNDIDYDIDNDNDYDKIKQSLNSINKYQKTSDLTTNNVITRVSSSRAHSSNMTPRRTTVPLNEQDLPYSSNKYGNGIDYIGSTSDLYPNNYGAGNPTDMYVANQNVKIIGQKLRK